ncbi:MAG: DNA-protecting protein DprA [Muribaculaceae bacterium]|nr:DNA-protecting protein DprA [Muribaculaceae bacterium]
MNLMDIIKIEKTDPEFPRSLRRIGADCPEAIYCRGNLGLLSQHNRIAIIGARAADGEGCGAAYRLGQIWARNGYVVVSGLALGCDTAAHRGCLDEGGKTIAIVASGLGWKYSQHPQPDRIL